MRDPYRKCSHTNNGRGRKEEDMNIIWWCFCNCFLFLFFFSTSSTLFVPFCNNRGRPIFIWFHQKSNIIQYLPENLHHIIHEKVFQRRRHTFPSFLFVIFNQFLNKYTSYSSSRYKTIHTLKCIVHGPVHALGQPANTFWSWWVRLYVSDYIQIALVLTSLLLRADRVRVHCFHFDTKT